jgi:acetolactate decarboxylase
MAKKKGFSMRVFNRFAYAPVGLVFFCVFAQGCDSARDLAHRDNLYQVSTINALMEGVLDAEVNLKALRQHGDFGIGTFEGLDGELAALGGKFYQVKADGKAYLADDSSKSPFANVKFFKADNAFYIDGEVGIEHLKERIYQEMRSKNIFCAVRVTGKFKYVKTRSVPKQNKPYVSLAEAVKSQKVFELHDVEGAGAGFCFPEYVKGINMPGLHMHFLTARRDAGGHVLECVIKGAVVEIDETNELSLYLPLNNNFFRADFSGDIQKALEKAEK